MPIIRGRLQRRDVGGAIRPSRADGRRLEGERDGSRSRRPAATVSERGVSNGAEPETAERHMAARPWGSDPRVHPYGRPQLAAGLKIAADAGAERQPVGRATAPFHGCRVGTRVPVAPSPALPAGPVALAAREGRIADSHQMESALGARKRNHCTPQPHHLGARLELLPAVEAHTHGLSKPRPTRPARGDDRGGPGSCRDKRTREQLAVQEDCALRGRLFYAL